jgi:TolB protein
MIRLFSASLCAAVFLSASAHAQDRPVVVIDDTARHAIHVAPFSGPNAAEAARVLENDLKMSGSFRIVPAAAATFTARATVSGGAVSGTLSSKSGAPGFTQSFNGDWRRATHLFADEIVRAVTGTPGFASSRITFVSAHTGNKEIYVMDIDGANVRQLTNDKTISLGPKLSYDGQRIAYTSYRSHFPDVWVINLTAGNRNKVAFYPGLNSGASFSPDGSRLALTLSKDGNTELYTINASGGSPNRLTRTRGTEASPVWSPDGARIAYVSDDRGTPQIFIIPQNGGTPSRIDTGSNYTTEPDWSPDGKHLAYSVRVAGQSQIGMIALQGGRQTILTTSGGCETPAWLRNSRHLVYARGGSLYLLDSLTKESLIIQNGLTRNTEPHSTR